MTAIPTLETQRLILREIRESDLAAYKRNFVDYEVIRYLSAVVPWPYPEDGVETFLKSVSPQLGKDRWLWGLFLKDNLEELIGTVDLWREGRPENRGFWLARKYWGQGLMTEAVTSVMDYAFDYLGFETLIFANALGNIASRRVKEKTGATLLRISTAKFVDPAVTQSEIWELHKADWKSRKR